MRVKSNEPVARTQLRAFLRRLKHTGHITTANGKANMYAGCTSLSLQLVTSTSTKPLTLSYRCIRAAIHYLHEERTVTRNDLKPYSKGFNSALLGILIEICGKNGQVLRLPSGRVRLTLVGVRYYFAVADRSPRDLAVAAANGARYILLSYAHLRGRRAWKLHVKRLGLRVLLDSGAYSIWRAQRAGKAVPSVVLSEYIAFIQDNQDVIQGYINLDVIGDSAATHQHAKQMQAAGLCPILVWHAGSPLRELHDLLQHELPMVAIGGTVGMSEKKRNRLFRWIFHVFPGQNFHFLGGSSRLVHTYPWFSADFTGWLMGRKYGALITANGQKRVTGVPGLEVMAENCRYLSRLN